MALREYQTAVIGRIRSAMRQGHRRVVLVSPTGSGKTITLVDIAARTVQTGRKVLWLAHRSELIDQAIETLQSAGLTVGALCASSAAAPNPYAPVQVASVQTLLARNLRPAADMVFADECHHFCDAAETFAALLKDYANAWTIGATATPERGDGCGLRGCFDSLVVGATVAELTAQGFLVPCEVLRPDKPLEPGKIAQSPVDAYMTHAAGRLAIVFARGVSLANEYADQFNARGVTARAVSAETPWAERRLYIDAFRRGAIRVLTSVGVLTEGFDAPETSACILARGCGSAGLYLQMVGRVLRPAPGKKDAVLLDLRGVSHEHGRPEDEREYSLDGRGIRLRDPQSYCPVCGAAKAPGEPCASCGYEPSGDETAKPDTITGAPLKPWMRLRETDDDGMRVKRLARWIADAKRRSFKDGWFKAKFNAVYGRWPSALELEKAREIAWATGRAQEVRT